MQDRIRFRFQDDAIARAQNEAQVYVLVPRSYKGDWQHCMGVVTHLYMAAAPGFGIVKARELAKEAVKPDAPLADISYCWEGIGEEAIPAIQPLYGNASGDVAFAAARAGAFLGDTTAVDALSLIAATEAHPFQLNAIKTLGSLRETPQITRILTDLLSAKNALVRIEAYHGLARQGAPSILSREIRDRFVIDRVVCGGAPMIYATRSGVPRIAIFGQNLPLRTPILFSAMDDQFTISSNEGDKSMVVFDRTNASARAAAQAHIRPDLYELMRCLGGDSNDGFAFEYSEIVGILQALAGQQNIPASFVLQDQPNLQEALEEPPPLPPAPAGGERTEPSALDLLKREK